MLFLLLEVFFLLLQCFFTNFFLYFLLLFGQVTEIQEEGHWVTFWGCLWSVSSLDFIVEHQRHPFVDVSKGILHNFVVGIWDGIKDVIFFSWVNFNNFSFFLNQLFSKIRADFSHLRHKPQLLNLPIRRQFSQIVVPDTHFLLLSENAEHELVIRCETVSHHIASHFVLFIYFALDHVPNYQRTAAMRR